MIKYTVYLFLILNVLIFTEESSFDNYFDDMNSKWEDSIEKNNKKWDLNEKESNEKFEAHMKNTDEKWKEYNKRIEKRWRENREKVEKVWGTYKVGKSSEWIDYSKDKKTYSVVNYNEKDGGYIEVKTVKSKDKKKAKQAIKEQLDKILEKEEIKELFVREDIKEENIQQTDQEKVEKIKIKKIVLDKKEIILDEIGTKRRLDLSIYPPKIPGEIKWTSSNNEIVGVSSNGVIIAKSEGSAVVTAISENGDIKDNCFVDVKLPIQEIKLSKDKIELNKMGDIYKFNTNHSNKELNWKVKDKKIISVDNFGEIKAKKSGITEVIVSAKENPEIKTEAEVIVNIPGKDIKLNKKDIVIKDINKTIKIDAKVLPKQAFQKLKWRSKNPEVVSVSSNGVVTPKKSGEALIEVSSYYQSNKVARCKVKVEIPVNNIKTEKKFAFNSVDTKKRFSASIEPEYASQKVYWKSENPEIVSISKDGVAKANSDGKTRLIVYSKINNNKKSFVDVKVDLPIKRVELSENQVKVKKNEEKIQLSGQVYPISANQSIKWESKNSKIASVSKNGVVELKRAGKTEIVGYSSKDNSKLDICELIIEKNKDKKKVYRIKVPMVNDWLDKRASPYTKLAKKYSERFDISPEFIMAIIHSESSFNPHTNSGAGAYGLMQLIPRYGGREGYQYYHHFQKDRIPSVEEILNEDNNVAWGTAYFERLHKLYFKNIKDDEKRKYLAVASYNWGPTNMKRRVINKVDLDNMNAENFFGHLQKSDELPEETRNYLERVRKREIMYKNKYFR